jgi:hypothetical protein
VELDTEIIGEHRAKIVGSGVDEMGKLKLEDIAVPEAEVIQLKERLKAAKVKRLKNTRTNKRLSELFEMMTRAMAKKIGGITCVSIYLIGQMAKCHGEPVEAGAQTTGCERSEDRTRALRELERLGLAEVKWRGPRRCPLVKLTG